MKIKILLVVFLFISFGINAQEKAPPPIYTPRTYSINNKDSPAYQLIREHHHFPGCGEIIDDTKKWVCAYLNREKFIAGNLLYPDEAYDKNIEGVVILNYHVEKEGSLTNIRIVHGIGGGCDEEAIRIVARMPRFEFDKANRRPLREPQFIAIDFSKRNHRKNSLRYVNQYWKDTVELIEKEKLLFLEKNLIYPEEAFYNAIQGIVLVKIFADKRGRQIFEIEYGIDPACDKEALRLVKLMPKYKLGNWGKELNRKIQYVPILFSVYAYELWRNEGYQKD